MPPLSFGKSWLSRGRKRYESRRGTYRYRHLREISKRHIPRAGFLAKDAIIFQARRIGLAQGKTLVLDSIDDLNLASTLRSTPHRRIAPGD